MLEASWQSEVAAFRLESMAWLAMVAVKVDAEPFARTLVGSTFWFGGRFWGQLGRFPVWSWTQGISEQCISEPLGILVFSALTFHMKPRNLLNRSLVEPDCGTNRCIYFVPNLTVRLRGRSNRFGWNLLVAEMFAAISARECISIASLKESFSTSCKR